MHISSIESLRRVLKTHVSPRFDSDSARQLKVIEIGAADINGSYKKVFEPLGCSYLGVDLNAGPGVDTVLEDPYSLPFADSSFDVVLSGQTFEHSDHFWRLFDECCRIVKPNGLVIVLTPSSGPVHRFPVDCYRFNEDSMLALSRHSGVHLVDSWTSEFGPWHDTVGVFSRTLLPSGPDVYPPDTSLRLAQPVQNSFPPGVPDEVERGAGTEDCYDLLARAHRILRPDFYCEIGVEYGTSLRLADCNAVGIDPAPQLNHELDPRHRLSLTTSDDFFWLTDRSLISRPLDLCYVDGMHQIEYALRDFMYMETFCHASSVVVIDDIYPAHPLQGERIRQSRYWTGDIWKIITILQNVRPDLILIPLDTSPTGSLLVLGCDPNSRLLWEKYDILMEFAITYMTEVPGDIVNRSNSLDPRDPLLSRILELVAKSRGTPDAHSTLDRIRDLLTDAFPRTVVHK